MQDIGDGREASHAEAELCLHPWLVSGKDCRSEPQSWERCKPFIHNPQTFQMSWLMCVLAFASCLESLYQQMGMASPCV